MVEIRNFITICFETQQVGGKMSTSSNKKTHGFQTEVKQLLNLMINSLYSNKEIFLRELISNSADAADKLRFSAIEVPKLYGDDSELKVCVSFDKKAKTVTISDNGIGMTRDEVVDNLGTIAKSGSKEFFSSLSGDQAKDSELIGQFGVGFYSAFIVADKVEVKTLKADATSDKAVHWTSAGEGEYDIETISKESRGTEIVLHLKKEAKEFLDDSRLRHIITKYCDHINLPVMMEKTSVPEENESKDKKTKTSEIQFEAVNKATALWTLPKKDIKAEEYNEFYKYIAHDFTDPASWSHNKVEGKQDYTSLLYLPSRAPFDMYDQEQKHGLKLYVQKVFIMDDADHFLPRYLRFVKGVIDSKDLPLNVSREILQHSALVDKIKTACTKRVLGMLEKVAKSDDDYQKLWDQLGKVIKEGPIEDADNKERIAKLLRFSSTHNDNEAQNVSLEAYIGRMQKNQEKIYYITAESFTTANNSPQLEVFKKKNIEVLLLTDPVDEWLATHLPEFDGKSLQSVAKGDLDLSKLGDADKTPEKDKKEKEKGFESVIKQIKDVLKDKAKDVRLTDRLTSSPTCVVGDDSDMGLQMQKMLQAAGHAMPAAKPIFELNPEHKLIEGLKEETDDERFAEWTHVLFDQAILADGGHLDDPAGFVSRLNALLEKAA
jgi:molecular chaperone HtpG